MKWACWTGVNWEFPCRLSLNGSLLISIEKAKSSDVVSVLGPNVGMDCFSPGLLQPSNPLSTYFWEAMIFAGGIPWNYTLMLSPSQSIRASYSQGWYSASWCSTANKGLSDPHIILLLLIKIIDTTFHWGFTRHLLTTVPIYKLWWSACSTRHIVWGNDLLIYTG